MGSNEFRWACKDIDDFNCKSKNKLIRKTGLTEVKW